MVNNSFSTKNFTSGQAKGPITGGPSRWDMFHVPFCAPVRGGGTGQGSGSSEAAAAKPAAEV